MNRPSFAACPAPAARAVTRGSSDPMPQRTTSPCSPERSRGPKTLLRRSRPPSTFDCRRAKARSALGARKLHALLVERNPGKHVPSARDDNASPTTSSCSRAWCDCTVQWIRDTECGVVHRLQGLAVPAARDRYGRRGRPAQPMRTTRHAILPPSGCRRLWSGHGRSARVAAQAAQQPASQPARLARDRRCVTCVGSDFSRRGARRRRCAKTVVDVTYLPSRRARAARGPDRRWCAARAACRARTTTAGRPRAPCRACSCRARCGGPRHRSRDRSRLDR